MGAAPTVLGPYGPTAGNLLDGLRQATWYNRLGADPSGYLYHYTDVGGVNGIITNKTIYATHSRFLNDKSEWTHGTDYFNTALTEFGGSDAFRDAASRFSTQLGLGQRRYDSYVTSFSANADSITQWRAYGHAGEGYALGAAIDDLRDLAERYGAALGQVYYEGSIKSLVLKNYFTRIADYLTKTLAAATDTDAYEAAILEAVEGLDAVMGFSSAYFKDERFSSEEEWRIVKLLAVQSASSSQVQYRPSRGLMIPYCEVTLVAGAANVPFKHFIYGPTADPEMAKAGLEIFLAARSIVSPRITGSLVPLRF